MEALFDDNSERVSIDKEEDLEQKVDMDMDCDQTNSEKMSDCNDRSSRPGRALGGCATRVYHLSTRWHVQNRSEQCSLTATNVGDMPSSAQEIFGFNGYVINFLCESLG